jgi:hypothetical protein
MKSRMLGLLGSGAILAALALSPLTASAQTAFNYPSNWCGTYYSTTGNCYGGYNNGYLYNNYSGYQNYNPYYNQTYSMYPYYNNQYSMNYYNQYPNNYYSYQNYMMYGNNYNYNSGYGYNNYQNNYQLICPQGYYLSGNLCYHY